MTVARREFQSAREASPTTGIVGHWLVRTYQVICVSISGVTQPSVLSVRFSTNQSGRINHVRTVRRALLWE